MRVKFLIETVKLQLNATKEAIWKKKSVQSNINHEERASVCKYYSGAQV